MYINTHTHTNTHTYICINTYIYIYIYIYIYKYIYIYIYMYIYTHTHVYIHIYTGLEIGCIALPHASHFWSHCESHWKSDSPNYFGTVNHFWPIVNYFFN